MSLIQPFAPDTGAIKPDIAVKDASLKGEGNGSVTMGAENLVCANNRDDGEVNGDCRGDTGKNQEVDVLECSEGVSPVVVKEEDVDADATEYSSSFGDTFSGSNEGLMMNSSDAEVEVESPLCIQNGHQRAFGEPVRFFKKKKVTAHWRKFISPLMWRCQWLELRMKELQSQALRYDKELAAYTHEKQLQLKMIDLNDSVSRAVPLTSKTYKNPAMKRRKRRRNEDSINILSSMSSHNIFSYYENKKCETDGLSVDDDFSDQVDDITRGTDDHLWALDFRDGDCSLEQILWNIETLQSRVLKIKAHLSELISLNVRDVDLTCNFMEEDQPVSSAHSPSCSHSNNEHDVEVVLVNSPAHQAEVGAVVLSGSAVSSFGDAPGVDIIESTVGLLSGADGRLNPDQLQEFCKANSDDVLISNRAADEELQSFGISHMREKPREELATIKPPNSDDESSAPAPAPASMVLEPTIEEHEEEGLLIVPPQPFHTAKRRGRKPKRRRRGGSIIGWNAERLQKMRKLSR